MATDAAVALGICLLGRHTHGATVTEKQAEVSPGTPGKVINSGAPRIAWRLLFWRGEQTQKYENVVMWTGCYSGGVLPSMHWAMSPVLSAGGKKEGIATYKLPTTSKYPHTHGEGEPLYLIV